jgi:hypothetical protein
MNPSLTPEALVVYKARTLRQLDNYSGLEARESQVITDFQINYNAATAPDHVRQALGALKDDGLATRRIDDLRGPVFRITLAGRKAAAALILDEGM